MIKRCLWVTLALLPVALVAQTRGGLDPATILKPLAESWPTYSGDYTGRRYSSLTQINQTTVKNLGLAWVSRGFVAGLRPDRPRRPAPAGRRSAAAAVAAATAD